MADDPKKLKFLSIGVFVGKGKDLAKKMKINETVKMCRVYGLATGTRTRNNKFGEQAEFRGQFEAINCITGVVGRSSRLYLPSEAADEVESSLKGDAENKGVKFAYEISITKDDSDREYFYTVTSLLDPVHSDVLNDLRKAAGAGEKETMKKK